MGAPGLQPWCRSGALRLRWAAGSLLGSLSFVPRAFKTPSRGWSCQAVTSAEKGPSQVIRGPQGGRQRA